MAQGGNDDAGNLDDEEVEVRGTITFKPAIEFLPATRRTDRIKQERAEEKKRKEQQRENLKRQAEQEMAAKLQREQQEKKKAAIREQQKREQERRKKEEEEATKQMHGGFDLIRDALKNNTSARDITFCGIELTNVRVRLLAQAMEKNTTCISLDMNRKGLTDEDGVQLAGMISNNSNLQKLECEGNNLGVKTAEELGKALRTNKSLRCLNLESNNLTSNGSEQKGIIELAKGLRANNTLRVLMLCKNGINEQAGEFLAEAVENNESLTIVDLSGNDQSLSVAQLRRIDDAVQRNRQRQSAIRRAERRERFTLYNEEFKCRQYCMQVEASRLEIEAHEERRLNRTKARFERWAEEKMQRQADEKAKQDELIEDAHARAEANKAKGKKGKKKK